jgi:thioredoxin 1
MSRLNCVVALALLMQIPGSARSLARAQSGVRPAAVATQSAFEPLDRWKAAVLAGNQAALAALYTTLPPAQAQTPEGTTQDPGEEPRFWSALATSGLNDFQPKVLAIERRQPNEIEVVLRIEGKVHTSSGPQTFLVEAHQLWVLQGNQWFIAATRRSEPSPTPLMRLPEPAQPNTALYAPPEDAQAEIAATLASAAKDHKRVILVFGANWCYDCHVLDATFRSKQFAPFVNANYHVVHINVGDDGDKNLDLAESYGVPLKKAFRIPSLAVLDPDGKVVYSQKNGEFDDSVRIGPADVNDFLKRWAPTNPSSLQPSH